MLGTQSSILGDGNALASGEGNSALSQSSVNGSVYNINDINVFASTPDAFLASRCTLTKTATFDLLKLFDENSTDGGTGRYSLEPPSGIREKLQHNDAMGYWPTFTNHSQDYMKINEVMEGFPNSERVVEKVADIYQEVAQHGPDGEPLPKNGYALLQQTISGVHDVILRDKRIGSSEIYSETIDAFCVALVEYCVTKCKVLVNPEAAS